LFEIRYEDVLVVGTVLPVEIAEMDDAVVEGRGGKNLVNDITLLL
jgi:hypothetical protein